MNELERGCSWHFAKQPDASQDIGPNNAVAEHFSTTPYPSLIREAIQNSLDVVLDNSQPVRMTFEFGNLRLKTFEAFSKLREHIHGVIKLYKDKAKPQYADMLTCFDNVINNQKNIGFIKVSDYNTKGMDYKGDDSPFHAFVRAVGLTVKDESSSGGSFGFGKAAYFMMSPIHTILVSTMTKEHKTFFEGAASLCTHLYRGEDGILTKYLHYGYYDNQGGKHPAKDDDIPTRFRRDEVGTDIYIMGVDTNNNKKEEAYNEMIDSAIRNFWMAFLHNKLEVVIGDITINQSTIDELMKERFPEIHDTSRSGDNYNPRPYYEAVIKANTSKDFLKFNQEHSILGHTTLYLWRNKDARDGVIHLRKQRMFIYRSRRYTSSYGYYAVFLCTSNIGNKLLQSIEDPSHKLWDAKRNRTCGRFICDEIETFVKECVDKAFTAEDNGALGIERLEDYLFVPEELIASDKDNLKDNPFFGTPSDEQQEEGTSPVTVLTPPETKIPTERNEAWGNVVTVSSTQGEKCLSGGDIGGHQRSYGKSKKKGSGNNPDLAGFAESNDSNENEGSYFRNIPVRYRIMAETKNNRIVHTIIIDSDFDVDNGTISILVSGEENDETIEITSSSLGTPIDNLITNLKLSSMHKNVIEIEFEDNMKHAIKLSAYEFK